MLIPLVVEQDKIVVGGREPAGQDGACAWIMDTDLRIRPLDRYVMAQPFTKLDMIIDDQNAHSVKPISLDQVRAK